MSGSAASPDPAAGHESVGSEAVRSPTHQRHWTHTFTDGTKELRLHSSDDAEPPARAAEADAATGGAAEAADVDADGAAAADAVDGDGELPAAEEEGDTGSEQEEEQAGAGAGAAAAGADDEAPLVAAEEDQDTHMGDEYRDDTGGGDDDDGDDAAEDEYEDAPQSLGLRAGHRKFQQHSPDRVGEDDEAEYVAEDDEEEGMGGHGADDIDEAEEFGEGVMEQEEEEEVEGEEAEDEEDEEGEEEEEDYSPARSATMHPRPRAAAAAPSKSAPSDDDSDAIDLTLSDDDEPPPPKPAARAAAAAPAAADDSDSSSSSGSSSSNSSVSDVPAAATATEPTAAEPISRIPVTSPTSPDSPVPSNAHFSPLAAESSQFVLPVAATATTAATASTVAAAAVASPPPSSLPSLSPKPLFSAPVASSPSAYSSRGGAGGAAARAQASKASFMSPPHRPMRSPSAAREEQARDVPAHAASASAAAAASPSPPAAAASSGTSSSGGGSGLFRSQHSTSNPRQRLPIKQWPPVRLYRMPHTATLLMMHPVVPPRRPTRIEYNFDSFVPQLEFNPPHSYAASSCSSPSRGLLLPGSLISRPASHASFQAADAAALQRQGRSTFSQLERIRIQRRTEQLERQAAAIARHMHARQQTIDDELTSLTSSLSLRDEGAKGDASLSLTRATYRTGSLAARDRFVGLDVSRRMFEHAVAPRAVVDLLVADLEAEVRAELALDTVAAAKKVAPLSPKDLKASTDLLLTPSRKVVVDKFNIEITGELLSCLRNLNWLNDEVINFYLELLRERSLRHRQAGASCSTPGQLSKVHFFSSFFFTKLFQGREYTHKSVARWSRSAKIDVALLDKLIMPVHVGENHWCCAVANIRERRLEYYDSLGRGNARCMEYLRRYVADEVKAHHPELVAEYNVEAWPALETLRTVPQQNNGSDCGVFSLKFADYLSENRPFDFTHKDMPYFRRRIALEIAYQRVL